MAPSVRFSKIHKKGPALYRKLPSSKSRPIFSRIVSQRKTVMGKIFFHSGESLCCIEVLHKKQYKDATVIASF